jgi:hypothetical protein
MDPNSFFSNSDPHFLFYSDTDSDSNPNILSRHFFKWCLSLLSYVFWNLYDIEKSFLTEKCRFFLSFKCLICYFSRKFLFYNKVLIWIRIRILTFGLWFGSGQKLTDSFGLGFGSTTLPLMIRHCFCDSWK